MENEHTDMRKVLYIILAVAIALSIWYYVDEHGDNGSPRSVSVTITDIPIEYLGATTILADKGLMLKTGEDSKTDETIDLTIEGQRRLVVQLDRSKIRVTADLSGITGAGVQTVRYTPAYTDRKFSSDTLRVKESSIYLASVDICELNRKEVEVRCDISGNVAEGFSAGELSVSPRTIEIRGQESAVQAVSYARAVLNLGQDATEGVTEKLDYEFCDEHGTVLDRSNLHTEVTRIQVSLPVYVVKELPLAVDLIESPGARVKDTVWEISPQTVVVSGDASILNEIDKIVLGELNLSEVSAESATHSYAIILPEGCQNLSGVTRATLEIACPERSGAVVAASRFRYENLPEGKTAEILTEELNVQIFGLTDMVQSVTAEDLVVVTDLSSYADTTGTYAVPAWIETEPDIDVGIRGEYQVQVTIR